MMNRPPEHIVDTLDLVCLILGHEPCGHKRTCMKKASFLNSLMNLNITAIDDRTLLRVKRKLSEKPDLTPENIKSKSKACAGICQWVFGIVNYNDIYKMVQLKRDELRRKKENKREDEKESKIEEKKSRENAKIKNAEIKIVDIASPELSRALAPIFDREAEIKREIGNLNTQIALICELRSCLVEVLSS
jgi:hypothetical protein